MSMLKRMWSHRYALFNGETEEKFTVFEEPMRQPLTYATATFVLLLQVCLDTEKSVSYDVSDIHTEKLTSYLD